MQRFSLYFLYVTELLFFFFFLFFHPSLPHATQQKYSIVITMRKLHFIYLLGYKKFLYVSLNVTALLSMAANAKQWHEHIPAISHSKKNTKMKKKEKKRRQTNKQFLHTLFSLTLIDCIRLSLFHISLFTLQFFLLLLLLRCCCLLALSFIISRRGRKKQQKGEYLM